MDPMTMHWSHQLHQAASDGNLALLQHWLEQGTHPDTIGGSLCWLRGASETCTRTPLHYAAKGGQVKSVRLLLRYGANPNARDGDGYTPVHYVCQIHNPSSPEAKEGVWLCLTSLIEFGGNTKLCTNGGYTPSMLARQQRNNVCAKELEKQGTKCTADNSQHMYTPCSELQVKPLMVLCRNAVSALIHQQVLDSAHKLWIPDSLKRYLLFEDVLAKWTRY